MTTFVSISFLIQPLLGLAIFLFDFEYKLFNETFVYKPWRLYLFVTSLIPAFCYIAIWFLPESPKFLHNTGSYTKALVILQKIYCINNSDTKMVNYGT